MGRMMLPPPFPIQIDDLTTELIGEALGAEVSAISSARIGADRGMLGELFLVDVTYRDATASANRPAQIVAKFAALRAGALDSARRGGTHERELRCYAELLADTPVAAPRCYGAWYDPATAHFLLLQEAIDVDGSVDQIAGITIEQAAAVLTQAARLHAHWWRRAELTEATWLPRLDSDARIGNLTHIAANGWPVLADILGEELEADDRVFGERLAGELAPALRRLASLPSTLLHCDLRADNLLFSPTDGTVTLVDWQGAGLGPPAFDLAYFLVQSLSVDERRANETALLDFYRTELAACGLSLTSDEVLAGYGDALHYGLTIACALPLISDPGEPRVRQLASTMARRSIEALRDHQRDTDQIIRRTEHDRTT